MADLSAVPVEDDLDLDYGELGVDPNADGVLVEAPRYERSGPPPHASGEDWAAYFRAYRTARDAQGVFEAGGGRRVLEAHHDGARDLPNAAKRMVARLSPHWELRTQQSLVAVDALLFVGNTDGHSKGDLRTVAHEVAYWGVQGVLERSGTRVAVFWATWAQRRIPGEKPGSNVLESAVTWDLATGTAVQKARAFSEWLEILTP